MLNARHGIITTSSNTRAILLRDQGTFAYDIHLIHYAWLGTNVMATDEFAAMALSQRKVDQVDDQGVVALLTMVRDQGIFSAVSFNADLVTTGAVAAIGAHSIMFPKPYRVPWLAALFNVGVAVAISIGVDVWFDRVQVSSREKAFLVSIAGGAARTE